MSSLPRRLGAVVKDPALLALLGDSRAAQAFADINALRNLSAGNPLTWANAYCGHRAKLTGNFGLSGDRSDQALARLTSALQSGAGTLGIIMGVNDLTAAGGAGFTSTAGPMSGQTITLTNAASHIFANIQYATQQAFVVGVRYVVIALEAGANILGASAITALNALNALLRAYAPTDPRIILIDLPAAYWDATTSASAIVFKTGYMRDTTHAAALGSSVAGLLYQTVFESIMPARSAHRGDIYEATPDAWSASLLTNGDWTTPTGGSAGTGITAPGGVPSGWTVDRTGSATATFSLETVGGVKRGVLACTFTAAGEEIRFRQDISLTNLGLMDTLRAACRVDVDAGSSIAIPYLYLGLNNGGAITNDSFDMLPLGTDAGPNTAYSLELETRDDPFPNPAKGFATFRMRVAAGAAGTATVRFSKANARRKTSDYP